MKAMVWSKDDPAYRQCALTVMDNIADPDITFDGKGICNYFYELKLSEEQKVFKGKDGEGRPKQLIEKIKNAGRNNQYDWLIGPSGGVDSTYVAYLVKQHGL